MDVKMGLTLLERKPTESACLARQQMTSTSGQSYIGSTIVNYVYRVYIPDYKMVYITTHNRKLQA